MSSILEMNAITRILGSGHTAVEALRDVTVMVGPGEFVAVMGPSGSGKTTLLSIAGGLDRPTAGSVKVEGAEISNMGADELARLRRQKIGYVFQHLNLIEGLTAVENVSLPLELDGIGRRGAKDAAIAALTTVGIEELAEQVDFEQGSIVFAHTYCFIVAKGETAHMRIGNAFPGPGTYEVRARAISKRDCGARASQPSRWDVEQVQIPA